MAVGSIAAPTATAADTAAPAPGAAGAAPSAGMADDPLWYQDAVVYQLNVKAFFDSNDDGIGDFQGVRAKLGYLKDLGINTIWLMPFYPSPMRDDGYDISDYYNVHPQYGTLDDFQAMLDEAHRLDLRVITELVINHTSDAHPWFQAARRAPPGSSERDFYVWSDSDHRYAGTRIIFTDTETSNWTWDPLAKAFYWHRFFSHQPDLNYDNPAVLEGVLGIMRFWLDAGVDGFRLDAIPYLVERDGTSNENLPETHAVIKKLRAAIDANYRNRFLLAEANQWPEDVADYFGDGDECHAAYHFPLMPRMYMAIAQEDRYPVLEIMAQTPEIPPNCQWAIFLRNHDELTLEMVTSRERDYMYRIYAADPQARINLGIRRRLAPLMENDPDRIKLMNSLLLSMRGSPIIYCGDEIGMGDNVFAGDRNGVRTPMQWSPDRNGGFSRADPQRLYLPPIMDATYGYGAVNVEVQLRNSSSLLHWMRRMLAVRQSSKVFGRGELRFLRPGNRKILAYVRSYEDDIILCVANLARSAQPLELDLAEFKGRVPVELLGRTTFPPIGELPYLLTIPAYGFYWFRLTADAEVPSWHEERLPAEDRPVLVLIDSWQTLFRELVAPWRGGLSQKAREKFENEIVPRFVEAQRWYAGKGEAVRQAEIADHAIWKRGADSWLLALVNVQAPTGRGTYFLPLALAWDEGDDERLRAIAVSSLARVRQQARVGVIGDAFADAGFCRALLAAIGASIDVDTQLGRLQFRPTASFAALAGDDVETLPVARLQSQGSNSVVTVGDRLIIKGYRRLRVGGNPEFEVGTFLTERAHFEHCVPVAGVVEHLTREGQKRTLAIVLAYVANQGDGWQYTQDYLQRHLDLRRVTTEPMPADVHGAYLTLIATLGQRTAQLHAAFSLHSGDAQFDPEPLTDEDTQAYRRRAAVELHTAFDALQARLDDLPAADREAARGVLAARSVFERHIETLELADPRGLKTRVHGDFHLGQVLLARNDFVIIDFEGEPGRSFEERIAKQPPLRDVAGMLRSFSYARAFALGAVAGSDDETAFLAPFADAWEQDVRSAFLHAYDEAVRSSGQTSVFGRRAGLLMLFELEKTCYELRYELDNRPDWARIPIGDLARMLAGQQGGIGAAGGAEGAADWS
ncbi:MAG: maltose alpha-D-glucosyltransferase [Burkholderiales bacterium]|nr:maltose alpha-D-glucosyltransferase [Burkholderiales bacterium]